MALIDYANPTRFLAFAERVLPWLIGLTGLAFAGGLYLIQGAPDDYQQGATVKIMFLHVPSAWLSMFGWSVLLAAIPVLALQGTITLGCAQLAQNFPQHQALFLSVNSVAGLLVFAVALVILQLKKIELADYLPSLFFAPVLTYFLG